MAAITISSTCTDLISYRHLFLLLFNQTKENAQMSVTLISSYKHLTISTITGPVTGLPSEHNALNLL